MSIRSVLAIVGVVLLAACTTVDGRPPPLMPAVDQPPSSSVSYFAPSLWEPSTTCNYTGTPKQFPVIDDFSNTWYSRLFDLMKEPSLYSFSNDIHHSDSNSLRFTWLRSFDPSVIIRVDFATSASPRLIAKQISDDSRNFDRRMIRNLSPDEATRLKLLIQRSRILDLPANEGCILQMDGSRWIFEAADKSGYHFVERLSPQSGPAREVGEFLLTLTGWSFGDIY